MVLEHPIGFTAAASCEKNPTFYLQAALDSIGPHVNIENLVQLTTDSPVQSDAFKATNNVLGE